MITGISVRVPILVLAMLAFGPSHGATADRAVRIFITDSGHQVTGDRVPASSINTILFTQEPCPLPLEDARGMHRAWMAFGAYQLGCWYPTIDDGFVFLGALPSLTHKSEVSWEAFPRALLHADGSATIIEPDFDSSTFMARVMSKITMRAFSHLHDTP